MRTQPSSSTRLSEGQHHAGRVVGAVDRAQHARWVLQPAPDYAQEITADVTEQDRPGVLKRRDGWFDGPLDLDPERLVFIDRDNSIAYVVQVLVPELTAGTIAIMHSLSSHKASAAREGIQAAGATLLLLPPYTPDFHTIEQAFSMLKTHLREAAASTIHGL